MPDDAARPRLIVPCARRASTASAGGWDFLVARYDAGGNVLWVKTGGGLGEARETALTQTEVGPCCTVDVAVVRLGP